VLTATRLETRAARRELPGVTVVRAGVGLSGLRSPVRAEVLISVGLCGGLIAETEPGTVVIPTVIAHGERRAVCDETWSDALTAAAFRLRVPVVRAPLVSTAVMVTGDERAGWAREGFAAVDMETGRAAMGAPRVAAVRVVLDSPRRELSPGWRHPGMAMLDPRLWSQALWLARHAPAYARRAATVVGSALADRDVETEI
jgi:hypothetical protein